jgi:DNA-binding response OmpR family regulator
MNKRVLIAYDDAGVVDLLTRRCRDFGLNVDSTRDAATALSKAEETLPDVVILDVDLHDGNGLSVCDAMAKHERLRTLPVVLLTGAAKDEAARRSPQLGAHYVVKSPDLWSRVEPVLQDLFGLKNGEARQQHGGPAAEPDAGEVDGPMDLIDAVFSVLGVETGDRLFGDDFSDRKKRSDQPWILSIDDDDDIALALRLRLKEYGAQVIRAADGMEGYRRAFTEVPRAIILDYELPGCNGDDVLRRLKESPVTRSIPVIVLTGHRETSIERRMWELGASEYLTKPLNWNRLRGALQVFLGVDRGTDAASRSPTETRLAYAGDSMSPACNEFPANRR